MFDIEQALRKNKLFKNFSNQEINQFLISSQYRTINYKSGQVIAIEGEPLDKIGLILDGEIEVHKYYTSGTKFVVNQLIAGDVFGEVVIFSFQTVFPSTIFSASNSKIMFLSKDKILKMCYRNEKFLRNLLQLLSEKILFLDGRLEFVSGKTIRHKICSYLLDLCYEQKTLQVYISLSREKMAEKFGIARPSLSRELSNMKKDGLIELQKNYITIKDLHALEKIL